MVFLNSIFAILSTIFALFVKLLSTKSKLTTVKAGFQHLGFNQAEDSFYCYWVRSDYFGFHWHYHPELEITYVHQGQGIRMVGDNVGYFREGDFVLLGSNLPHTWISDDDFKQKSEQMEVIVLQFPPHFFSPAWLRMPEMSSLARLLTMVDRGISFSEATKESAVPILTQLIEAQGIRRISLLLELLHVLGHDRTPQYLASSGFSPSLSTSAEERLLKVCRHLHDHFTQPIRLAELAQLANMNTSAFCRFFRRMTGQSVSEYLSDLRIGKACNLLIDRQQNSISAIAHEAGFNSQTLFNRTFQNKKGMTPSAFRKQFAPSRTLSN